MTPRNIYLIIFIFSSATVIGLMTESYFAGFDTLFSARPGRRAIAFLLIICVVLAIASLNKLQELREEEKRKKKKEKPDDEDAS